MRKPTGLKKLAINTTFWIGSPASIIFHTMLFAAGFIVIFFNLLPVDLILLIFNTIVSLEAIYLALFNQLAINYANEGIEAVGQDLDEMQEDVEEIQKDVDEIQGDVDELQEDVEEIEKDVDEDEKRDVEQAKTLSDIQNDLRKLMSDIDKLQQSRA